MPNNVSPRHDLSFAISLGISLIFPLYFGGVSLFYALSHDYIVQDDARLHIVWLQRFVDADLFSHDLIAHYYTTIQAVGFKAIYYTIAQLGIPPLLWAKILPILLAMVATVYLVRLSIVLFPNPIAACLVAMVFNQNIWLKDDLISATPRAFIYPLFIAFLYYLVQRSRILCGVTLVLQGLIYPQILLVSVATLTLRVVHGHLGKFRRHLPLDYGLWLLGLGTAIAVGWLFSQTVSHEWGTLATAEQMQQMPEFGVQGRREYFGVNPIQFWFAGASGLRLPLFPPIIVIGFALPRWFWSTTGRSPIPASSGLLLAQVSIGSLGLFTLAHCLFPKLYLPSRYTFYSSRIVFAIAAGWVLALMLEAGWRKWQTSYPSPRPWSYQFGAGLAGLWAIAIVLVPAVPSLFLSCQGWVIGEHPTIYRFFADQPKSIRIASLTEEANNIPAFSQRSIWVAEEFALAYHLQFYTQLTRRIVDLLHAHYSTDLSELQRLIHDNQIDYFLVDRQFAQPDTLTQQAWLMQSSFRSDVDEAIAHLRQGKIPALTPFLDTCVTVSSKNLTVLDASCITGVQS